MQSYKVLALTQSGKKVTETVVTDDPLNIHDHLKEKDLYLINYKVKTRSDKDRFKTVDLIIFTQQLGTMIAAGLSILKALQIIEGRVAQPKIRTVYRKLAQEIQKGNALSVAMQKQGGAFPEILINMVAAGETGGTIDRSLELMAKHFDKELKLKNKIKAASTYPIILAVVAVAVVVLLVTFVLPNITSMFEEDELPGLTRMVMGFSHFLTGYWYILIGGFFGLSALTGFALAQPEIRLQFDRFKLTMPVLGKLNRTIVSARCARSFSSLYLSGIQTLPMISATAKILDNSYIERAFSVVSYQVSQGETISRAIEGMNIFDPMLSSMINVGEETGALGDILVSTAEYFDGESDAALQKMLSMMEPIMLIVMGVIIGIIVVSFMLPMFTMNEAILN